MSKRRWLCLTATALALPTVLRAQTPLGTAFTYQGQLKQGGVPVNGTCDFIFALWDHPELAEPAHNKGEAGEGGVQVSNGLFALKVDFGGGAFDGSARWLQAHVCCPSGSCAGDVGWEMLSPRQELTPMPYALFAASADGGVGGFWSASGDHIYNTNVGNVGIGTSTPAGILDVRGPNGGDILLGVNDAGARIITTDADGNLNLRPRLDGAGVFARDGNTPKGIRLYGGGVNRVQSVDIDGVSPFTLAINPEGGNVGIGTDTPSARLDVAAGDIHLDANRELRFTDNGRIISHDDKHALLFRRDENKLELREYGDIILSAGATASQETGTVVVKASGNVGIGTPDPQARLDVAGYIHSYNPSGVGVRGHSASDDGVVGRTDSSEKSGVFGNSLVGTGVTGRSEAVGGHGVAGHAVGQDGRGVYGTAVNGVGVYGHSEAAAAIEGHNSSTSEWTPAIYGQNQGAGDGVYGWSQSRYGTVGVTLSPDPSHAAVWAKNNGAGAGILAEAGSGGYAGVFNGRIKANVVEITGGSDLSEQFDITRGQHEVIPGMVVCIDPINPGSLVVSTRIYDRTVAGIVSGAGGVKPGMLMGQTGSLANGEHAVALTGRVWAWCDASDGPIQPGDLLTTSNTPGHAMKVSDYDKARGAIIGKAMSLLEEETGLVLVLVLPQ